MKFRKVQAVLYLMLACLPVSSSSAWSASLSFLVAEAGSTGGSFGNDNKSLSGGADPAKPVARPPSRPLVRPPPRIARKPVKPAVAPRETASAPREAGIDQQCSQMDQKVKCTCAVQNGGYISGRHWYTARFSGTVNEGYIKCLIARGVR